MAFEFHEEDVAAFLARHRERLDPGEVELLFLWHREGVGQPAGLVLDLEHQRRFVATGAAGVGVADDGESRGVAGDVFDIFSEHIEPIVHARLPAGDRRGVRCFGGRLGCAARARDLDKSGIRQVAGQPVAALGESLRSAVDLRDPGAVAGGQERVMDSERHLGTDLHWQPRKVVERVGDPTIGRVLQRHDAVVGVAGVHLFECCRDAPHRHEFHGTAKTVEGGQVAVGPCRAQVGDAQVLLDRAGA